MSLLADLLAKLKQPDSRRDVPPNLKNIVQSSSEKSSGRKKIILFSVILIFSITAGFALIYFIRSSIKSDSSLTVTTSPVMTKNESLHNAADSLSPVNVSETRKSSTRNRSKTSPTKGEEAGKLPTHSVSKKITEKNAANKKLKNVAQASHKEEGPVLESSRYQAGERSPREHDRLSKRDAYLYSARNHELTEDYANAVSDYKNALKLDKNNFMIMNTIAYLYLKLGSYKDSIRFAEMAVQQKEDYVPALINLAIAYAKSDNFKNARRHLEKALSISPENQTVILNLALLDELVNDLRGAEAQFKHLVELGNPDGLTGLARIYEKRGEYDRAVSIYRQIITLEGSNKSQKLNARQRVMAIMSSRRDDSNNN